jgi:hypothetical protein
MSKVWRIAVAGVVAASAIALSAPAGADANTAEVAARKLVRSIPVNHRYQCKISDPTDPTQVGTVIVTEAASISAFVSCGPSGAANYVGYAQMTNAEAMNRLYLHFAEGSGGTTRSTDGKCPSEGEWDLGGDTVGRVACYYSTQGGDGTTIEETVSRVWTDDVNNIIGFASASHGDIDAVALRDWWVDDAGPTENPEDVPELAPSSDAAVAKARRDLARHVPADIRKSCRPTDRNATNDRLWVRAELLCEAGTDTGVDLLYYNSVDPTVIDNIFEGTKPPSDTFDGDCPNVGVFSVGSGKKEHEIGEFSCKIIPANAQPVRYVWSDRDRGIIMYAYGTDVDAVKAFVDSGNGDAVDAQVRKPG